MAQTKFAKAVQKSAAHAAEVSLQLLNIKHACKTGLLATSSDWMQKSLTATLSSDASRRNCLNQTFTGLIGETSTLTSQGSKGLQQKPLGRTVLGCAKAH